MRICIFMCAVLLAAVPASAQEVALGIDLIPGHPVYHELEKEAGVAMALTIIPGQDHAANLTELCEELRVAAGLANENGDGLRLQTLFVVPYKKMAVEGYYLPNDGTFEQDALVPGNGIARTTLDRIVARAGIPPGVLDETNVEHEISCRPDQPLWHIAWYDVRRIGNEEPEAVIERAHHRFLAIHQSVVEHVIRNRHLQEVPRATIGG
jgi:hypothetical protein